MLPLMRYAAQHRQGLALLLEELQSQKRMPTCRAIMLQLYITLSLAGYTHVRVFQEPLHQLAFENASELYRNMQDVFAQDPRFQMKIEHRSLE